MMMLQKVLNKIKVAFAKYRIGYIILASLLLICIVLLLNDHCNKPKSEYKTNSSSVTGNDSSYIIRHINDSVSYAESQSQLAESRAKLIRLQDAFAKALISASKLQPDGTVTWKETIQYKDLSASYDSAVTAKAQTIIEQQKLLDSLKLGNEFICVPLNFSLKNKWIEETGTVRKSNVDINTIKVFSENTVAFGSTQKKFLGIPIARPIVKAIVGNKNPYATQSDVQSFQYKPKQSRFSLVVGTGVSYNLKKVKYVPLQATFGVRIF